MSAKPSQRVAAFALAGVFFLSSIALTVFVIWQMREESKATTTQVTPTTSESNESQENKEVLKGTQLQNFTPSADAVAQLTSVDTVVGEGAEVKKGDTITANYTGALVKTGTIFESSLDAKPFTAKLLTPEENGGQGLIKGWVEGIPGMKVGGKRRLTIPASLAYGSQDSSSIPANSDLVFDIEILSVNN